MVYSWQSYKDLQKLHKISAFTLNNLKFKFFPQLVRWELNDVPGMEIQSCKESTYKQTLWILTGKTTDEEKGRAYSAFGC